MIRSNVVYGIAILGIMFTAILAYYFFESPPQQVVINEEATFSGSLDGAGDYRYHTFRTYDNMSEVHFLLRCPGKDFDLYVRLGQLPSTDHYDYRGYQSGGEDFSIDYPVAGIWYIMVHSYSGTGHYDLFIDYEFI